MVAVLALDAAGHRYARGSGVVFARARVVTACHIIALARGIAVQQPARGGAVAPAMKARLLAHDYDRDLCVLSVPELRPPGPNEWEPLAFAPPPVAGQQVRVVGAPMARPIVKRGVVTDPSARVRGFPRSSPGDGSAIKSDAAIPIGFSGGAMFDLDGRLVGIVFATRVPTAVVVSHDEATGKLVLSYTPHDPETFAVPGRAVKKLLARIAPGNDAARKRDSCFGSPTAACVLAAMHRMAGAIGSPRRRAEALGAIVSAELAAGDSPAARATLDRALEAVATVRPPNSRLVPYLSLGAALSRAADGQARRALLASVERAAGSVGTLRPFIDPPALLAGTVKLATGLSAALAIFLIHVDSGDEGANADSVDAELRNSFIDRAVGVNVRGSLAPIDSEARSGKIDAAIASARLLDSGLERSLAWALIALVMAENGDARRAQTTMGKANRAFEDHVESETTGDASRDREVDIDAMLAAWRWKLVAGKAVTFAELGRFDEALELTRGIMDDNLAVAALGEVAAALSRRDGGVENSPSRVRRGAD